MAATLHTYFMSNFVPILEGLLGILDKGAAHAETSKQDLVHARLAPDMFDLAMQIREVCHYAKDGSARLAGRSGFTKDEIGIRDSFPALRAQVEDALAHVKSIPASDFDGAETRDCSIHMRDGKRVMDMDGMRFFNGWLLPQFYFHTVTAYDILRHHGTPLVKMDYEKQVADFIRNK